MNTPLSGFISLALFGDIMGMLQSMTVVVAILWFLRRRSPRSFAKGLNRRIETDICEYSLTEHTLNNFQMEDPLQTKS